MSDWRLGSVFQTRLKKKKNFPCRLGRCLSHFSPAGSCFLLEPPGIGRVKNPLTQDALGLLFSPDNRIGWRGLGRQVAGLEMHPWGGGMGKLVLSHWVHESNCVCVCVSGEGIREPRDTGAPAR